MLNTGAKYLQIKRKAPLNISLLSHMLADNKMHLQLIWNIMRGMLLHYMIVLCKLMNAYLPITQRNQAIGKLVFIHFVQRYHSHRSSAYHSPLPLERGWG